MGATKEQVARVRAWSRGLRELAGFANAHPEGFVGTLDELAEVSAALGLSDMRGHECADWYVWSRHFGPHTVDLNIRREVVCDRVQVGTRIVQRPNPDLVAALPLVDVEEPIYKWTCPPEIDGSS